VGNNSEGPACKDWGTNHVPEICGRKRLGCEMLKILGKVKGAVGPDFFFFAFKLKTGFGVCFSGLLELLLLLFYFIMDALLCYTLFSKR
jgi:hypothetical protein